ncbi:MAG: GYD domain-containing protein [Planctomycetes bacterium]|nr:GYD domain-containing protein [Planctomycetota bacterium]
MPTYVRLVRMTEQGLRSASRIDEMIADAHRVWEASGVRIVQAFATLGSYDIVAVAEAPDDAAMARASALVAGQGNFRAETCPAVPLREFAQAVKR